jgi:hypothetical protein
MDPNMPERPDPPKIIQTYEVTDVLRLKCARINSGVCGLGGLSGLPLRVDHPIYISSYPFHIQSKPQVSHQRRIKISVFRAGLTATAAAARWLETHALLLHAGATAVGSATKL